MSLTLIPVTPKPQPSDRGKVYTIHKGQNAVYATKPVSDKVLISVVGFKREYHAKLIASMLEEYKIKMGEWPPLFSNEELWLPSSSDNLRELDIIEWEKDELDHFCVLHILDLVVINTIDDNAKGYRVVGDTYKYDVPKETYYNIFNNKLML
jgi:hypothetical protein